MRVLVAGVGNIFFGDDGFGVEVARRLQQRPRPEELTVIDFGIRGLDLAYALLDDLALAIIVDAVRRRGAPGTLYVLEPDEADSSVANDRMESHGMVLENVFRFARQLGGPLPPIRIVGCEPARVDEDPEGNIGLSSVVEAAVEPAIEIVQSLICDALSRSKTKVSVNGQEQA